MTARQTVHVGNFSDVGRVRKENEDYFAFYEYDDPELSNRKGQLVIVADGMGGFAGGYAASRIAVEVVRAKYAGHPGNDPREALKEAFEAANQEIFNQAQQDPAYEGMGTTLTALVYRDGQVHLAHVGDSRAYLIRGGKITQLTRDHSKVARMVEKGIITPEEAEDHPEKNVLEQAVGHKKVVEVDISVPPMETQPGDRFLLCSDGLHGLVSDDEMARGAGDADPNDASQELVELANERGGHDNITVQIVQVIGESPKGLPVPDGDTFHDQPGAEPPRRGSLLLKGLVAFLLLGIGLGVGYFLFGRKPVVEDGKVVTDAGPLPPIKYDISPPEPSIDAPVEPDDSLEDPVQETAEERRRRLAQNRRARRARRRRQKAAEQARLEEIERARQNSRPDSGQSARDRSVPDQKKMDLKTKPDTKPLQNYPPTRRYGPPPPG